jgi:hypothetical protein
MTAELECETTDPVEAGRLLEDAEWVTAAAEVPGLGRRALRRGSSPGTQQSVDSVLLLEG